MPGAGPGRQFAYVVSKLSRGTSAGCPRCQFFFTLPFALLSGGAYGVELAARTGLATGWAVVLCALGLPAFVALQLALEPMAVGMVTGGGSDWDEAVAFIWDSVTGAVVGFPLFTLLGVQTLRLDDEAGATPDLARLADAHPDTPEGAWAAQRLADIKGRIPKGP